MSAAGGIDDRAGAPSVLRRIERNVRDAIATLLRPPRHAVPWPTRARLTLGAVLALAAIVATMALFDGWAVAAARLLPADVVAAFDRLTDFGRSGWFLWPIGILLIAIAVLDTAPVSSFSRQVLAAWTVRLGFIFTAIALPGLFVTIVKRLIGRARPVASDGDVWAFMPFIWRVEYASLPSGHATTAFSALVAIGAVFPATRALMWIYAVMIAISRVVVTAHHPSDVLAGAIVGALGALLVRNWFAARGLGFVPQANGVLRPLPGPDWWRIRRAIVRRLRP